MNQPKVSLAQMGLVVLLLLSACTRVGIEPESCPKDNGFELPLSTVELQEGPHSLPAADWGGNVTKRQGNSSPLADEFDGICIDILVDLDTEKPGRWTASFWQLSSDQNALEMRRGLIPWVRNPDAFGVLPTSTTIPELGDAASVHCGSVVDAAGGVEQCVVVEVYWSYRNVATALFLVDVPLDDVSRWQQVIEDTAIELANTTD